MNRFCKQTLAILCSVSLCSAFAEEKKVEWLDVLKEKVGAQPCPGTSEDLDSIRENKHPGERYFHVFRMNLDGTGTAKSSRLRGWWKTSASVPFRHVSTLMLRETIVSTEQELNEGIICSKYEIQSSETQLITAKAGVSLGPVDSVDVLKFISEIGEQHGIKMEGAGDKLITSALLLLAAPEAISKVVALKLAGFGAAVKIAAKLAKKAPKDGYISLDEESLKEYLPEYNSFVTKVDNLEGTTAFATWECGKGYTSIRITTPRNDRVSEEDLEMIAKLIYRTNPAVTWRLYPEKVGDVKTVDAAEIGGLIFTNAVDFDRIVGQFQIKNRGLSKNGDHEQYRDIAAAINQGRKQGQVTPKDITCEEIGIMENGSNHIALLCRAEKNESATLSLVPHGSFYVTKADPSKGIPNFVRRATLEGELDARIENEKGWMQGISIDERGVKVQFNYTQTFLGGAVNE